MITYEYNVVSLNATIAEEGESAMASAMASPDDLTKLPSLDPASIEKALKARFDAGKIYTKVNSLLVAVNPYKTIDGIYTAETLRAYTQYAKLPPQPHVYSVAADAYRGLLESHSQTLIISGESGAGARALARACAASGGAKRLAQRVGRAARARSINHRRQDGDVQGGAAVPRARRDELVLLHVRVWPRGADCRVDAGARGFW